MRVLLVLVLMLVLEVEVVVCVFAVFFLWLVVGLAPRVLQRQRLHEMNESLV